ncbi:MAG: hypothetical protein J2P53_14600 [Bradyrhizobiaceae bacterium]|nr:hypothetical protein [Bradyrhizobiaceae bacterium]
MKGPVLLRTFLAFFLGGLLLATVVISLVMSGSMIWAGCFHDDPGYLCGDALLFAAVTPFYGVVFAMFAGFLSLLAGAVLAAVGRAVLGHVPLWYAMVSLPLCLLAYYVQGAPWFEDGPMSERLMLVAALQGAALLTGWWLDGRHTHRLMTIPGLDPEDGKAS